MDLKNKSVLVTGAAMGLGKLYAEEFLKRGAKVKHIPRNSVLKYTTFELTKVLKLAEFAYMKAKSWQQESLPTNVD